MWSYVWFDAEHQSTLNGVLTQYYYRQQPQRNTQMHACMHAHNWTKIMM